MTRNPRIAGDISLKEIHGCQLIRFASIKDSVSVLGETSRARCSFSGRNSGGAVLG